MCFTTCLLVARKWKKKPCYWHGHKITSTLIRFICLTAVHCNFTADMRLSIVSTVNNLFCADPSLLPSLWVCTRWSSVYEWNLSILSNKDACSWAWNCVQSNFFFCAFLRYFQRIFNFLCSIYPGRFLSTPVVSGCLLCCPGVKNISYQLCRSLSLDSILQYCSVSDPSWRHGGSMLPESGTLSSLSGLMQLVGRQEEQFLACESKKYWRNSYQKFNCWGLA